MDKSDINLKKIKHLRKRNHLTLIDAGKLIGVKQTGYFNKENGNRRITLEEAKILADHYGLTIEELFYDKNFS